jgi:hypothetical protein
MVRLSALCTVMLLTQALGPAVAQNRDPAENRGYTASLPGCDDPAVLGSLSSSFSKRERRFADGRLAVAAFGHVKSLGFRPWGADYIPRRFCSATAQFNDGLVRRVDYSVREGLGLWGWTWDVNWCVQGLDRHWTYQPECQMARP